MEYCRNQIYLKCEICAVKVSAEKTVFVEKPPAVLWIQLKRFDASFRKISKAIQISKNLDISKFVFKNSYSNEQMQVRYKLMSIVTHHGRAATSGHYTAVAETGVNNLYHFDDAKVKSIQPTSAWNKSSSILFYEICSDSWIEVHK